MRYCGGGEVLRASEALRSESAILSIFPVSDLILIISENHMRVVTDTPISNVSSAVVFTRRIPNLSVLLIRSRVGLLRDFGDASFEEVARIVDGILLELAISFAGFCVFRTRLSLLRCGSVRLIVFLAIACVKVDCDGLLLRHNFRRYRLGIF